MAERAATPPHPVPRHRRGQGGTGGGSSLRSQHLGRPAERRYRVAAEVPAIIITGDTARERLQEASATGARLLHKPVRAEEVHDALIGLLPPEGRA